MQQQKIKELTDRLIAKTKKGELTWYLTSDQSEFRSNFQNGSITINKWSVPNGSYVVDVIELKIYNNNGDEVDSLQIGDDVAADDEAFRKMQSLLKNLYDVVDNNYYRREETINAIMEELNNVDDVDDDIPF